MKPAVKRMALERMRILVDSAVSNARRDHALAQRQALLARGLSTRYRIRMPYEIRMTFCKKCKSFIPPGAHARVRVGGAGGGRGRSLKWVRVTCGFCGHVYRKAAPRGRPLQ